MLVECGFVRATTSDGAEFSFTPSLGRIAALGDPRELVGLFASLHGPDAAKTAPLVLAGLCDQDDLAALIGEPQATAKGITFSGGEMPPGERVLIAQHLMRHGMVGRARPGAGAGSGDYAEEFHVAEYIAAARAHLGMSAADAEALSMTELQLMLEMKFPDHAKAAGAQDLPSADEYEAAMAASAARRDVIMAKVEASHGH